MNKKKETPDDTQLKEVKDLVNCHDEVLDTHTGWLQDHDKAIEELTDKLTALLHRMNRHLPN